MASRLRKRGGRARGRRGGKLTKAEIKAAGGIPQAWAARKAGKKTGGKRKRSSGRRKAAAGHRKSAKRVAAGKKAAATRRRRKSAKAGSAPRRRRRKSGGKRKSAKRVAAGRKAARTRKRRKSAKAGGTRRRRKSGSKARRSSPRRRRRSRKTRRAISFRVPRKTKKVYVVASERRRRRGRRHHHYRRHGAMENPLSGTELFVGSLFGLVGFVAGDVADRFIATHALTDTNTKNAQGLEIYGDNPPTSGSYAGLFNPTAICAPMNLPRWANAIGVPGLFFVIAHFVKSPVARSAMQFAAFGYGARTVGKALLDGIAVIARPTKLGQQLYAGEMRSIALKANGGNNQAQTVKDLPSPGLGKPRTLGPAGAGYPSMPVEKAAPTAATAPQQPAPPGPQAPPPPPATTPQPASPAFRSTVLTGPPAYRPWGDYGN